jgi:hypothetical protein
MTSPLKGLWGCAHSNEDSESELSFVVINQSDAHELKAAKLAYYQK